jgi:hypothetical protein
MKMVSWLAPFLNCGHTRLGQSEPSSAIECEGLKRGAAATSDVAWPSRPCASRAGRPRHALGRTPFGPTNRRSAGRTDP